MVRDGIGRMARTGSSFPNWASTPIVQGLPDSIERYQLRPSWPPPPPSVFMGDDESVQSMIGTNY